MRNLLLLFAGLALSTLNSSCGWPGGDQPPSNHLPRQIIGKWKSTPYSTDPMHPGYSSTLEIFNDGTFSKAQYDYRSSFEFVGTVSRKQDRTLEFHVKQIVETKLPSLRQGFVVRENKTGTTVDELFHCEFSIDQSGTLTLHMVGRRPFEPSIGISFETYTRQ